MRGTHAAHHRRRRSHIKDLDHAPCDSIVCASTSRKEPVGEMRLRIHSLWPRACRRRFAPPLAQRSAVSACASATSPNFGEGDDAGGGVSGSSGGDDATGSASGGNGDASAGSTSSGGSSSSGSSSTGASSHSGTSSSSAASSSSSGSGGATHDAAGNDARESGATSSRGDAGDPLAAARQECVNRINKHRSTLSLAPLSLAPETTETCSDRGAMEDATSGTAHGSAGMCPGTGAQGHLSEPSPSGARGRR